MKFSRIFILLFIFLIMVQGCTNNAHSAAKEVPAGTLKGIDLSGITDTQKDEIFNILSTYNCPCGCNKGNLFVCLNTPTEKCPQCKLATKMANYVKERVVAGEPEENILAFVDNELKTIEANRKRKEEMYAKTYEIDTKGAHFMGKEDAKVAFIVFSDFECPFCVKAQNVFEALVKEFPNDVKVIWIHNPLRMHKNAFNLAVASEAAGLQGKFNEMASLIFKNKGPYSDEKMIDLAKQIGLDTEKFKNDLKSETVIARVNSDQQKAASQGITGTPSVILNKKMIRKQLTVEFFKDLVQKELNLKK